MEADNFTKFQPYTTSVKIHILPTCFHVIAVKLVGRICLADLLAVLQFFGCIIILVLSTVVQ